MTNTDTTAVIAEAPAPTVFEVPAYRYEEFTKLVDKANRRLAKAGGADAPQFTFTFETFEVEQRRPTLFYAIDGSTEPTGVFLPYFRATLLNDSFRIAVGDHTFVASLIAEEAGYTVHTAPGESLDGWTRPAVDDIHCDVCNTVRARQNIYIVRDNTTGELIQVGTNCLAPLLGFSPQSLWALTWTESLASLTGGGDDEDGWAGYRGAADRTVAIDTILAIAWAVTNGGKNYVSTKAADAYFEASNGEAHKVTTVSQIRGHLAGRPKPWKGDDRMGQAWDAIQAKVEATSQETIDAIKAAAAALKAGTDYADNMTTILAAESGRVTFRNVGILGSLVAIYAREQQLAEERKVEAKTAVTGFLAPVKDNKGKATRLHGLEITLTYVREFDGSYGTTTKMVGTAASGHAVEWWGTGSFSVEAGDVITLDASIKAHRAAGADKYTKADTTVLTRGKIID